MKKIKKDDRPIDVSDKEKVITDEQALAEMKEDLHLSQKDKQKSFYIKTVNVFGEPLKKRYERHYVEKKHHLAIDILLFLIVILLLVANGIFLAKKSKDYHFDFFGPKEEVLEELLEVKGFVNQEGESAIGPGDELEYVVVLKNVSSKIIENLNVEAEIVAGAVDLESLVSNGSLENQKIKWTRDEIQSFAEMKPGDELEIDFSFVIKDKIGVANPMVDMTLHFRGLVGERSVGFSEKLAPLKISSDLSLEAKYRYFTEEGEQLGFGTWPIEIGKETTVRVFLNLVNSLNAVKNVKVQAVLPESVSWTGHEVVNSGKLPVYSEGERMVTWQIPEVKTSKDLVAHFELTFEPEKEQVVLLEDIVIFGEDVFTGKKIERYFTDLVIVK